jgi:TPR repeat protein
MNWFYKSAQQGYAPSMYSYGLACKSGRGVAKSIPLAVYWLTRAVDEGYEPAKARLEKLLQEERNAL